MDAVLEAVVSFELRREQHSSEVVADCLLDPDFHNRVHVRAT